MSEQWTQEQKKTIDMPCGCGNILVSAAAGSGKTAVLVERLFDKISKNKMDVDSFLVVTFTNAAASEMKSKIENRLLKELENSHNYDDELFWTKQIKLIGTAQISTIDSFCINTMRNNFQYAGIDPNFIIMDNMEYMLLCDNVIDELFDDLYESGEEWFLWIVDRYADFRSDDRFVRLIKYIYNFIGAFAEPFSWLRLQTENYRTDMENSHLVKLCIEAYIKPLANDMAAALDNTIAQLKEKCDDYEQKYAMISESIINMKTAMDKLKNISGLDELFDWNKEYKHCENLLAEAFPKRLSSKQRKDEIINEFVDKVKKLNGEAVRISGLMPYTSTDELRQSLKSDELAKIAESLFKIISEFDKRLMNEKHKRNSYTFSDIERMTYNLFRDNPDIKENYRKKYNEIMIDEYQDTNGLQDAIFSSISNNNIFMVGDLKQSIYRFRGGDPYIFKAKSQAYNAESAGVKIELSKNFRSRGEIIDSVNDIFDNIMSDKIGDVEYKEKERLECGVNDDEDSRYYSEFYVLGIKEAENEETDVEFEEALYTAKLIKNMCGTIFYDFKLGRKRPLQYGDFTVLLREVKNSAQIYSEAFEKLGVPLLAEVNDYFENHEIKVMMSLISVIDNAKQDIPLFTVLRSLIFGFSDTDIARVVINSSDSHGSLYESIEKYAKNRTKLGEKCDRAVKCIKRWREYLKYKSVASLIWTIYEETGFHDKAAAVGGETARENLRLLYRRAKKYENSGFRGLFSFTRYMENLKEKGEDINGAGAIRNDAVSLMTIHKSKGLEFPVVILGGLGKKSLRKQIGIERRVLLHKDYGIGLMYPDMENERYLPTVFNMFIEDKINAEELSEKMRLLYVAMTRPKYKLIATAAYKIETDDGLEKMQDKLRSRKVEIKNAQRYADWILPSALCSEFWKVEFENLEKMDTEEEVVQEVKLSEGGENLRSMVEYILDYKYPYLDSTVIPSRTTPTQLKALNMPKTYDYSSIRRPNFALKGKDPARRGTAYHNLAAYIDLGAVTQNLSYDTVNVELDRLVAEGRIEKEYADEDMVISMLKYLQSRLGKRMLNAKKIYREKSFQLMVDSSLYKPTSLKEDMILQGIIDCFFVEDDSEAVLVDYKTDKIVDGNTQNVRESYTQQLELYAMAIEKALGIKVKEKYLYLFDIGEALKI